MNKELIKKINEFKQKSKNDKTVSIMTIIGILLAIYIVCGILVGTFFSSIYSVGGRSEGAIYYGLINSGGRLFTTLIFILVVILLVSVITKTDRRNYGIFKDERGVTSMQDGTFGTARFMTDAEAKLVYTVGDVRNITNTCYGQLTENGEQAVCFKPKPYGSPGGQLQNMLIIGHPGAGKSMTFVGLEIINTVLRGDSGVFTDPSGELYTLFSSFCKSIVGEENVFLLNPPNPKHSDSWNMLAETISPETGRIDGTRLNMFVEVYLKNMSSGEDKQYFMDLATALFSAAIGFVAWKHEECLVGHLKEVYECVTNKPRNKGLSSEFQNSKMKHITWYINVIYGEAENNKIDKSIVDKLIKLAYEKADIEKPFTMERVRHYLIYEFDKIDEEFTEDKKVPLTQPGKAAYDLIKSGQFKEDDVKSGLQNIKNKLKLFVDEKLLYVVSHKGIDTTTFNKKQTIIFVAIPDLGTELKPITSLFFTFLIKNTMENFNRANEISMTKGEPNTCTDTTFMLDEFFSLGQIGNNEDFFVTYMSNSRKAHMHNYMIIQSTGQLYSTYGGHLPDVIKSDCEGVLVLSVNDTGTAEYIQQMLGEATVMTESHQENTGIFGGATDNSMRTSAGRRFLMTIDEIKRNKDALLFKQGEYPLKLKKFYYTSHPLAKHLIKQGASIAIKSYDDKKLQDEIDDKAIKVASIRSLFQHLIQVQVDNKVKIKNERLKKDKKQEQRNLFEQGSDMNESKTPSTKIEFDGVELFDDLQINEPLIEEKDKENNAQKVVKEQKDTKKDEIKEDKKTTEIKQIVGDDNFNKAKNDNDSNIESNTKRNNGRQSKINL